MQLTRFFYCYCIQLISSSSLCIPQLSFSFTFVSFISFTVADDLILRSIWEVPGLWMLSLSLSGARQRSGGSLSLPIGFRTGILASNFILKTGGFLKYQINFPLWVTGAHPFQPFSGVVGLAFSLLLAGIFYPKQPLYKKTTTKMIKD